MKVPIAANAAAGAAVSATAPRVAMVLEVVRAAMGPGPAVLAVRRGPVVSAADRAALAVLGVILAVPVRADRAVRAVRPRGSSGIQPAGRRSVATVGMTGGSRSSCRQSRSTCVPIPRASPRWPARSS